MNDEILCLKSADVGNPFKINPAPEDDTFATCVKKTAPDDLAAIETAARRKFPGMLEAEDAGRAEVEAIFASPALVAELRAILAPLLDEPMRPTGNINDDDECVFCQAVREIFSKTPTVHAPGCAVLRRDALLGR